MGKETPFHERASKASPSPYAQHLSAKDRLLSFDTSFRLSRRHTVDLCFCLVCLGAIASWSPPFCSCSYGIWFIYSCLSNLKKSCNRVFFSSSYFHIRL